MEVGKEDLRELLRRVHVEFPSREIVDLPFDGRDFHPELVRQFPEYIRVEPDAVLLHRSQDRYERHLDLLKQPPHIPT